MATIFPEAKDILAKALGKFTEEFHGDATIRVCAPGRVNLIGEHTDYNQGYVLPIALPMVTIIVGKPNGTNKCKIVSWSESIGSTDRVEFDCTRETIKPGEPKWANYIKGCFANFPVAVPGFDASILSTVPVGAGLSSSAALEVATYTFLETLTGAKAPKGEDKALACQRAEHDFAGVPCGIMDQFISVMGKEGHALLLDCKSLAVKQIPMSNMDDYVFVIANSNSPHKLSSSAYSQRRDMCFEAAKKLSKESLREATPEDLQVLQSSGASETMLKRARHVVGEIHRALQASAALEKDDFPEFGKLMNASHDSLRDDYEVSSEELDCLVNAAREVDGVLGSRLTGAGFGGCTVTLLRKDAVDRAIAHMKSRYPGTATFYIAKPAEGARNL